MDKQQTWPQGVFPARLIEALHQQGAIMARTAFDSDQVQPASLDLRLGDVAFRVRSSFLPGPSHSVAERIEALKLHEIDLTRGAVLERGCVYLVPLQESLALPAMVSASANPKSSTGRLDVFTRVIGDRARGFDQMPAGYAGPLYLEISPRTFPILVRTGSRLSQMRFRCGDNRLTVAEHQALHASDTLVFDNDVPVGEGENDLADMLEDEMVVDPFQQTVLGMRQEAVTSALTTLSERSRLVLEMRYGLNGRQPHYLDEVGAVLGVTRERVRQLEHRALQDLAAHAPHLEDFLV